MPRRTSVAHAEHEVVRACYQGLDVPAVQRAVLRSLRRVLPVDAAFFATADPETLLFTGALAEDPLAELQELFLDNEYATADVNKFSTLATSAGHVRSLDDATRDERRTSPRYREVMRPIGLGDELRAALVADGRCWGYLCLHREDTPTGFSSADRDALVRLGPHIAHALRQATLLHGRAGAASPARPGPGVLLLTDDLDIVATTPRADELLALIGPGPPGARLPVPAHAAAAALLAIERGRPTSAPTPSGRVRGADGSWLVVHASRMRGADDGGGPLVVTIEPADGPSTASLMLAAYGLTPRETDVARLVLRGSPTILIADTLHISRHTVQDHLKNVFDKVGVRSRRDLVGRLLGSP